MDIISSNYLPGDQRLIEQIVRELKSQGIFDQFRKECISDVDTKPAYQNLRQRVESSVAGFLTKQTWNPEMNKNQVREMLRKNIHDSGFLETGVERIVDQVVNPKITTVFLQKVEDVVYKFLGVEKPVKSEENVSSAVKTNSFHDLLPTDLEAVSPEMPGEASIEAKDEIDDVKMEENESTVFESLNEKVTPEENSVDSQESMVSGIVSQDSNHSQKQDSLMSLNSSESRMSLVISESTPKLESEDLFMSQKSSDSNSKSELVIDEKLSSESENQDVKTENEDPKVTVEESLNQNELKSEKISEEISSKPKEANDKKRERHHSSSDRSKSRSDKDRDKSKSDRNKKDDKDSSKEQKTEKKEEKYRIPKLSDKKKNEKDSKSKDKDDKNKEKSEKDSKERSEKDRDKSDKDIKSDKDKRSERDKRYDKDRKSSKHSSDRDRSKSDSKTRKDSQSDKKDDKKDRKDSSRSDKSKDDRKSSSSKRKESSSSKDRNKEKDKESNAKKIKEDAPDKSKNGHSSTSSSSSKRDSSSKHKRDEDKSKSSRKRDDKNEKEKDDKKKKRSSKDDHYSSKDKKNGRRSSDRDSDGPSNSKRAPTTPQKNSEASTQKLNEEIPSSNFENSTGDSGNSEKVEESNGTLQLGMEKIKLPKFASNLQEAMKIMKIRKQLKKLENLNQLNADNLEVKKLLKEIAELSKDGRKDKNTEKTEENSKSQDNQGSKSISIDISDFISSSNISMEKWSELEAKFMVQVGNVDYNSYESPYLDDEDTDGHNYELVEPDKKKKENAEENKPLMKEETVKETKPVKKEETKTKIIKKNDKQKKDENKEKNKKLNNNKNKAHENLIEEMGEEEDRLIREEMSVDEVNDTLVLEEQSIINESNIEEIQEMIVEEEFLIKEESSVDKGGNLGSTETEEEQLITEEIVEDGLENLGDMFEVIDETLQSDTEVLTEEATVIEETVNLKREEFDVVNSSEVPNPSETLLESPHLKESSSQEKLSSNESEKSAMVPSGDIFKRKAVVVLQKHSFTEDLIKFRRNGDNIEDKKEKLRNDKSLNILETEKENIELNQMVIVENIAVFQNDDVLENQTTNLKNNGEKTNKTLDNHVDEKINEEIAKIFLFKSNAMDEIKGDVSKNDSIEENSSEFEEDMCAGLESPENERNITILKCLIGNFEKNIEESISDIKKIGCVKEKKNVPKTRKRKLNEEQYDISNNNLKHSTPKRQKNNAVSNKSTPTSKGKGADNAIDISLDHKFSLPLSPAESEPSADKKIDAQTVSTRSRRQSGLRSNKNVEEADGLPQRETSTSPSKNVNDKTKTTRQRYSSDDLYKPRIFLRKREKNSKNS